MAIVLEAITHVWFAGRMIPPGEVFSSDDTFGKKLILGGSAKVAKAVDSKKEQPKGRRTNKTDVKPDETDL